MMSLEELEARRKATADPLEQAVLELGMQLERLYSVVEMALPYHVRDVVVSRVPPTPPRPMGE